MAVGDRFTHVLGHGDTYTPSGRNELVVSMSVDFFSEISIRYSGRSDFIRISSVRETDRHVQQDPGYVLTPETTLRAVSEVFYAIITNRSLFVIDPLNANNLSHPFGNLGIVPGLTGQPAALDAYSNGDLLVWNTVGEFFRVTLSPLQATRLSGSFSGSSADERSVDFFENGDILAATRDSLYRLNPADISDTAGSYQDAIVRPSGFSANITSIAQAGNDLFYVIEDAGGRPLWTFDANTSTWTEIGPTNVPSITRGATVTDGGILYIVDNGREMWRVDDPLIHPSRRVRIGTNVSTVGFPLGLTIATGNSNARVSTVEVP